MNHRPAKLFAMGNCFVAERYEGYGIRTISPSPTEASPTTKSGAPGIPETGRIPKPKLMLCSSLPPKMVVSMPLRETGQAERTVKAHALRPDQPQALRCRWG